MADLLHEQKVLILEKHFKFGGYTHTFKRNNYEWDVGIHYIGGNLHKRNSFIRRLFDYLSNNNLDWSRMDDIYDRMVFPDKTYDFVAGKQLFIEQMISYFPQEENAIKKYIELVNQVFKSSLSYYSNKALPGIIGSITYPFIKYFFFIYLQKIFKQAILTATPYSTCSWITLLLISSAKFVSISIPRFIGPGCIIIASSLA